MENEPPLEIDPYAILGLESSATATEVKSAYKKLALRNHPDKVAHHERDDAHSKFQEIAFAYAILSNERRRKRYDTTGNTAETLDINDDDFNWLDFFRAQWADTVTSEKLNDFAGRYKGSDEEKQDVLTAYRRVQGDLNKFFKEVMLCNVLDDEERFRVIINEAIRQGHVEAYDAYVNESEKKKQGRRKRAEKDATEAEKHAETLGLNGNKKNGKQRAKGGEDDLASMIQQRQKGRATNFLNDLEAKYAAPKTKKGKKRSMEEPPEGAFQKTAARAKKQKKRIVEDEDEEDEIDLDGDVVDDDDEEDGISEGNEDEYQVKPTKVKKKKAPKATNGKSRSSRKKS